MKLARLDERHFVLEDESDPLRTLYGRLDRPHDARAGAQLPYVLVLHGFKGFMDWGFFPELARRLVASGFAVVRFNFSGSGVGPDPLNFTERRAFFHNRPQRELEDVERVRAWLDGGALPWIDPARGALLGHSLGGAVALLHAARRADYRALVTWASVASWRRFPPEVEALWRRQGYVEIPNLRTGEILELGLGWLEDIERAAPALDVPAACRGLRVPTLLLHGTHDEAVPFAESRALHDSCAPGVARLELLDGANHTFGAVHPWSGSTAALERVFELSTAFVRRHAR